MDALFDTPNLPEVCTRCLRTADICVCDGPYLEILADGDQRENEIYFVCNICDADVTSTPCPEHAPVDVPDLVLIDCDAADAHPRTWVLARESGYGTPCPWCIYESARDRHAGCEHAQHGRWRAWRAARRAVRLLEVLGLSTGSSFRVGGGCPGCVYRVGWRWSR